MTQTITTPAVPLETVTPLKPSEAMRLGCLTTEQAFSELVTEDGAKACALGAMAIGYGVARADIAGITWWPESVPRTTLIDCPVQHGCWSSGSNTAVWMSDPGSLVMHLNDGHEWPRERIADLLSEHGL
jgi:hypothetical protein